MDKRKCMKTLYAILASLILCISLSTTAQAVPNGNLGPLLAQWAGNPSAASINSLDVVPGTMVWDSVDNVWFKKTLAKGTNTGGYALVSATVVTASTPLTGFSISFNALGNNETVYLTPAGTLATGTIVFPTDATSAIGQTLTLVSTQTQTALTVTSTSLTLVGTAVTALTANTEVSWKKVAASTWLRTK